MTVSTHAPATSPGVPPISHREGAMLGAEAYTRFADVVAGLTETQWDMPTDCDGWTVRHLVSHMVGAMRSAASFREMSSQQREIAKRIKRDGGNEVDMMCQVQIDRVQGLSNAELVAECRALQNKAATGRRRTPLPLRRFVSFGVEMGSINEKWRLGYLVDVILTRDAWLHRIDLCRAIGAQPLLTPDHDGRIIADVVTEWARRHGQPYRLTLTGPAGGTYSAGDSTIGQHLELDAVEFCRILSGRAAGEGQLLSTEVPF